MFHFIFRLENPYIINPCLYSVQTYLKIWAKIYLQLTLLALFPLWQSPSRRTSPARGSTILSLLSLHVVAKREPLLAWKNIEFQCCNIDRCKEKVNKKPKFDVFWNNLVEKETLNNQKSPEFLNILYTKPYLEALEENVWVCECVQWSMGLGRGVELWMWMARKGEENSFSPLFSAFYRDALIEVDLAFDFLIFYFTSITFYEIKDF